MHVTSLHFSLTPIHPCHSDLESNRDSAAKSDGTSLSMYVCMCGNLLCAGFASLGGWRGEVGGLAQVFIGLILLRLSSRQT